MTISQLGVKMNSIKPLLFVVGLAASVHVFGARPAVDDAPMDFNQDNKPDFVFRNRITSETQIWYMDGVDQKAGMPPKTISYPNTLPVLDPPPMGSNPDNFWRLVGAGYVDTENNNEIPDIIWQRMTDLTLAVWYMKNSGPTDGAMLDFSNVTYHYSDAAPVGWRLVGFGYFNDDKEAMHNNMNNS